MIFYFFISKSDKLDTLETVEIFIKFFFSIFWAIFGHKPLRVHRWDVLESISIKKRNEGYDLGDHSVLNDGSFATFPKSLACSVLKKLTSAGQKMPYLSQPRFHIRLCPQNVISKKSLIQTRG